MKTKVSNNIEITGTNKYLQQYCKSKLVVENPQYTSAKASGRKTFNIDKNIYLYKTSGDKLILPFGCLRDIYGMIDKNNVVLDFVDTSTNKMQGHIELYDYQQNAVNAVKMAKNGILKAPCGSGKTQMGLALIEQLGKKTLWLTHTADLLKQSKQRAEMYYKGDFGTVTGGKVHIGSDITFATVQTMCKLDLAQLANEFEMIIVDECHRCSGTPTQVSQFYKVLDNLKVRYKFGLTATTHRADDMMQCVYSLLGGVAYEVEEKHVTSTIKADIVKVETKLPLSLEYCGTDGKMIYHELIRYICGNEERNNLIKSLVNENENVLILTNLVDHCESLGKLLNTEFIATGKTSAKVRDAMFKTIKESNTKGNVLISTYSLAKEGLDIPNLDTLILASPQKDFAVVKQSIGRIERKATGKEKATVYDLVDVEIGYCRSSFTKRKAIYGIGRKRKK